MAVYVDELRACVRSRVWKWSESCHLFADSLEELHSVAERLGLRLEWFQDKPDLPHYDLNKSKRDAAVRLGLVQRVSRDFVVGFMRGRRSVSDEG